MTSKKWRFIFLITHLFLIFVDKESFSRIYGDEIFITIFFIIFEGFFEW